MEPEETHMEKYVDLKLQQVETRALRDLDRYGHRRIQCEDEK